MAVAPRSIDPSGIAPVIDPSVVGGAPDASPTTLVLQYLRQRGYTPSSENVRRALEANQRDPGVIPGLRSDRPATEAEDQAAMRAGGVRSGGARSGGGGGRTTSAAPTSNVDDSFFPAAPQTRPATATPASNDTFFPGQIPAAPPPPPNPDAFFPNAAGAPNTSASPPAATPTATPATTSLEGQPRATQIYGGVPIPAVSPSVAATPPVPTLPPSTATASPSTYDGPTPLGDARAIGNMISNGIDLPAISGFLQRTFAQRPTAAAPPPAPAEPPGPPTPLPWVVRALTEQSERSNVNPAPGVPTVRSPLQMYGGVPEPNAPLPPPVAPPEPSRPMRQQPIPVVRPSVMMSRPPPPLEAALQRALEDRKSQAVDDLAWHNSPEGARSPRVAVR